MRPETMYPDDERLVNPADEFYYTYVSSTYLDGFINYVKPERIFAELAYYDPPDEGPGGYDIRGSGSMSPPQEETDTMYQQMKERFEGKFHSKFGGAGDYNFFIFCSSREHWWMFYYDQDCSDCKLAKIRKTMASLDEVVKHYTKIERPELLCEFPVKWLSGWLGF